MKGVLFIFHVGEFLGSFHWDIMYCIVLSGMYYNQWCCGGKTQGMMNIYPSFSWPTWKDKGTNRIIEKLLLVDMIMLLLVIYIILYCILHLICACFEVHSKFWIVFKHLLQFLFVSIVVVIVPFHYRTVRGMISAFFCGWIISFHLHFYWLQWEERIYPRCRRCNRRHNKAGCPGPGGFGVLEQRSVGTFLLVDFKTKYEVVLDTKLLTKTCTLWANICKFCFFYSSMYLNKR